MSDFLNKIAKLDDQIINILDVGPDEDPDKAFEKAEELITERNNLIENPPEPPEIEQPAEREPPPEPIDIGNDPLNEIRGLTAVEIDKLLTIPEMSKLIFEATGEKPSGRLKAKELAEILYKLTKSDSSVNLEPKDKDNKSEKIEDNKSKDKSNSRNTASKLTFSDLLESL